MCAACDADEPKVLDEREVVGRKDHTCCECGGTIPKGFPHQYVRGLWSTWATFRTCLGCVAVRERVAAAERATSGFWLPSPPFGDLYEHACEWEVLPARNNDDVDHEKLHGYST